MKHHPVFQLSNKLQHKSYEPLSVLLFLDTQIEMGSELFFKNERNHSWKKKKFAGTDLKKNLNENTIDLLKERAILLNDRSVRKLTKQMEN